jgi:ABC-type transporter Mla MlaB component
MSAVAGEILHDPGHIVVSGVLDRAARARLLDAARAELVAGRDVELDLSALAALDLATYQLVLAFRRDAAERATQVRLVGLEPARFAAHERLGLLHALDRSVAWQVW